MKNFTQTALVGFAIATSLASMHFTFADDTTAAPHKHHHHGFGLGVCVGQTLAAQGVTLTPGDDSNREAFQSAIQSCKEKFKNRAPSSTTEPTSTPSG